MSTLAPRAVGDEQVNLEHLGWTTPEEILSQLERVVHSPHFRNSKRYPAFLRFIVEESLAGRTDCLKERTLGVEVFGRMVDYDTNADPVVRVTAGEIRKRIAQYYQSPDHEHELRFDLPIGSYVPHFLPPHLFVPPNLEAHLAAAQQETVSLPEPDFSLHLPEAKSAAGADLPGADLHGAAEVHPTGHVRPPLARTLIAIPRFRFALALALFTLIAAGTLLALRMLNHRRQEAGTSFFWGPLLRSKEPTTIVLGVHSFDTSGNDLSPASSARVAAEQQSVLSSMTRSDMVPVSDVVSYGDLISVLTQHSILFKTQGAAGTTFEQLRHGPVLLIGGFDNMWTMRLTSALRFRFFVATESINGIEDTEHPGVTWKFDNAQSTLSNSSDYAIVACFFDPQIEQHVLMVAGIGKNGTEAAAEFLTRNSYLKSWLAHAQVGNRDNIEVVLSTEIIEGQHGPPHVIASHAW